jgi:protein-S-isoprenylcysteine O-methyltransferase Ste14
VKQVVVSSFLMSIMMLVFFMAAGRTDIPRAWIFFVAAFTYNVLSTLIVFRYNPELIIVRLRVRREGSRRWDEVLMRITNLTGILLIPIVAGLDVGRYNWSFLQPVFLIPGFLLFITGAILVVWAMSVNKFFEPTVRIQIDRGHKVITTGPYELIRHPGYLSGILWMSSIPLIIGSTYAIIPLILYYILMILRTYLEDQTLQKELPGYSEYSKKVRYRLFPLIW